MDNNNQPWGNQQTQYQQNSQQQMPQYQQMQTQPMQQYQQMQAQQMPQYQQAPTQQMGMPKQGKPSGNGPKNNKGLLIGLIATGVLLVAAIVTIIILVVKGKDKDKKETTEWISEPTVTMTEEPDTETEEPTEEPTTEEPVAETFNYSNYYDVLTNLRYEIDCYYWQYGYAYSVDDVVPEPRPVAFSDITGDGIDEMLVMHATDEYCAVLDIYTISEDGSVTKLYSDNFDIQVAGGTVYYLYKTASSDHLYAYTSISDEWTNGKILEFVPASSSELTAKEIATFAEGPNEDYTELIGEYTIDGKECTSEDYRNYQNSLQDDATTVVMFNRNQSNDQTGVSDLLLHADDIAMSYSDAINHVLLVEPKMDGRLPIAKPIDLMFASGAGAWSTDIVLYPDGTFTGSYHDANMGESGDGYESTIYYCNFEGRFKNITMVDATTYRMELESLTVIAPEEEQMIEDNICYIKSEPYGISGGTIFDFYLPGIKVSNLPSGYVSWVWGLENAESMEHFGMYNIDTEQGFASY